jgi:hypothetical protein
MNLFFTKLSIALFFTVSPPKNEAQPSLQPATTAIAATGSDLLPFVPGRFLSYTLFDGENHNVGKLFYRYDKEIIGSYKIEKYDATGHLRRSGDGKLQCTSNTTSGDWTPKLLDVFFAYKDKVVSLKSNELPYPATINVGDFLPDGHAHLTVTDKWKQNADIEITASQRRVEAQELVAAAGTSYLCYRITYTQTIKTRTNNQDAVPIVFQQTEWVSATIGVVKTVTVSVATGKTINTSILSQISNELPPISTPPETPPASQIIEIPSELPSVQPPNLPPH